MDLSNKKIVTLFKNKNKLKSIGKLKNDYDNIFSWLVITRAGWKCERCGTQYEPPTKSLQNSHYENSDNMATRFMLDNCIAACNDCHTYNLGGKKQPTSEYVAIMKKKLGETRWNVLVLKIEMSQHIKNSFVRSDYIIMIAECVKDLKEISVYSPYRDTIKKYLTKFER